MENTNGLTIYQEKGIEAREGLKNALLSAKNVDELFDSPAILNHVNYNVLGKIHGYEQAEGFLQMEMFFFKSIIKESDKLKDCSVVSMYQAFVKVVGSGLSFNPTRRHVYLTPRYSKAAKCSVIITSPTSQWEVSSRVESGAIKHVNGPYLIHENDDFTMEIGCKPIHRPKLIDRGQVLAAWTEIIMPDGSASYPDLFTIDHMKALRKRSHDNNFNAKFHEAGADKANDLYGDKNLFGMDLGFFAEKALKHAFRSKSQTTSISKKAPDLLGWGDQVAPAQSLNAPHNSHASDYLAQESTIQQDASEQDQEPTSKYQANQPTSKGQAQDLNVPF